MFAAFPLLALPVLAYLLYALTLPGGLRSLEAAARLNQSVLAVPMSSGAPWALSVGDLLLAAALVVLFAEMLKATTSRSTAIINHALSMLLFVAALMAFLLLPAFATSTFFLLLLMVLSDVLAGFIVSIISARRDMDVTRDW